MADHDDAQDYTANGPSDYGFRTAGARIKYGVDVTGTTVGVRAHGGTSPAGGIGVSGRATSGYGVEGIAVEGIGVSGLSRGHRNDRSVGVLGSSQAERGVGVHGSGSTGVRGSGLRGGEFTCSREGAQISLIPSGLSVGEPPRTGRAGDVVVLTERVDPRQLGISPISDTDDRPIDVAQLWFCLRGRDDVRPAIWGKVQFSELRS